MLPLAASIAFSVEARDSQPAAAQSASVKLEDFTRAPAMSPPRVSPDSTHLAWIDKQTLVIYDIRDQTEKDVAAGKFPISDVEWIDNDNLVLYPPSTIGRKHVSAIRYGYSPVVVSKDGKVLRLLMSNELGNIFGGMLTPIVRYIRTPSPKVVTYVDDHVYTIDVANGKRTRGAKMMDGDTHAFDANGVERVAIEFKDEKFSYGVTSMKVRYHDKTGAQQTFDLPRQDKDNIYYTDFDYSEYDNGFYWSQFDYKTGTASTYRLDLATNQQSLFRNGTDKATDIMLDDKGKVVGIQTYSDREHIEWTDPYYKQMMETVQKLFPTASVDITNMSNDRQQIVFIVSGPEKPDTYYLFDAASRHLAEIGTNYPELEGQTLAPMTYVTYKARDGLDIPAYVTKRKDTPDGAPLIVLPHGGPAMRDTYGFNYEAQYFAHKGYVVLQPQYRGSYGFGDAFERAGNLHLAQMTTDLEDGVHFLAGQHMIDPSRVCIVGWSWGGYLAQAGLAFTDTYACGVSGDGVSDLIESLNEDDDIFWGGHATTYWREVIGRKGQDSELIHSVSPIGHVESIKAPLLLIHGQADPVVNVRQSDRMNAAMKRAGKDVTYIPVPDMLHGPDQAADRLTLLQDMDDFITKAFAKKAPDAATAKP